MIEIVSFRELNKNTLKGFVTVRLSNVGLEIRDIAIHEKNGKQWLQLPAKPYAKQDGSPGWSYILDFYDKDKLKSFQEVTLKMLQLFRGQVDRSKDDGFC